MAGSTDLEYPGELLCQARAEFISVAAMIDCLDDTSHPSIELIEAKRAIHSALMALGALGDALDTSPGADAMTRTERVTQKTGDVQWPSTFDDDLWVPIVLDERPVRPPEAPGPQR